MARSTKAGKRAATRGAAKKKPAKRTSQAKKGKAKKAATRKPKAGAGRRGPRGSEVEKRWSLYLRQRTALEQSVTAVQAAAEQLREAREVEVARRKEFDEAKSSLESLLEVDAAQGVGSRHGHERRPTDFPRAGSRPARERGGKGDKREGSEGGEQQALLG